MMKILGISGGTKNGNNDAVCKEALLGARESGAEIEFIRLPDLELKNCSGCGFCMKSLNTGTGGGCTIQDDFEWLRDRMLDADGIVFSMPVFEKGAPGVFHTVLDRFGPRHDRGTNLLGSRIAEERGGRKPDPRILKEKAVAFLGTGGTDYTTGFACDCAMLAGLMMWKVVENRVYSWTKCFILEEEKVTHAHLTGIRLAQAAKDPEHADYYGEKGVCPHCHSRNFYLDGGSDRVVCCLCGMEGTLKRIDHKLRFVFPPEQLSLAFDTIEGKLHHAEDIKRNQEIRLQMKGTDLYRQRQKKYMELIGASVPDRN